MTDFRVELDHQSIDMGRRRLWTNLWVSIKNVDNELGSVTDELALILAVF